MDIQQIPRHVSKAMLPGLKIGGLVKTKTVDYSQDSGFVIKPLPAGTVGRVKRMYDTGKNRSHRFLVYVKFEGHPLTNFHSEELVEVKI